MRRYFWILLLPFLFSSCLRNLEKEGITAETIYKGRVIDKDAKPLNGIMVRITNGSLINNSVTTDKDGLFQITVDINKIDKTYYIQIGDEGTLVKRSSLKGFGQDVYDYGDIPFVNINLPEIETLELTDMTPNSFTCKCNVKSEGGASLTERGVCWSTNIPTISDNKEKSGTGAGIFSCTISNTIFNFETTNYYARAYAINEYGVAYGESIEITPGKYAEFMKEKYPTVETVGLTAMTSNSFTCKCNVKSQGKAIVTERGICWSTSIPTIEDQVTQFGGGEGVYSCTVENLDITNTTYYVRAYAINEYGVAYGEPVEVNSSRMAYFSLPTMEFGGYTYHIHHDMGGMQWQQGYEACENLVAYGFDDWFMPNKEEMLAIATETNLNSENVYWTSSPYGDSHYYVLLDGGDWNASAYGGGYYNTLVLHIIPVRKDR